MGKLLFLPLLFILIASCGSDSGNSSGTQSVSDRIFSAADSTFTSVYSPVSSLLSNNPRALSTTFACDSHGNPGGAVPLADKGEAYFYCKLNTNDKSPETVQGGYFIMKAVLCSIGKQVKLIFPKVASEQEVSLDFDTDSCLTELGESGVMNLYVTQQRLTGADWDYKIILSETANAASPIYYIHLKSTDNILAIKATDYNDGQSLWQGFSLNMNMGDGEVRYDSWDPQYGRHLRLLVKGTLSTSGFSAVTSRFMAYADQEHIPANSVFVSGAWSATHERYVFEEVGVLATGYPTCASPCGTLMTIDYDADFADYTGWANGVNEAKLFDSTSLLLDYATIDTNALVQ